MFYGACQPGILDAVDSCPSRVREDVPDRAENATGYDRQQHDENEPRHHEKELAHHDKPPWVVVCNWTIHSTFALGNRAVF